MIESFTKEVVAYQKLSDVTLQAFTNILKLRIIRKGDYFLRQNEVPKSYAFVVKGLFSYYHIYENGDSVIKKFFYENSFVASTAALVQNAPSLFAIQALEETQILEYSNYDFRRLMQEYPEIALFHIHYLEKNWVVDKEPLEINLKYKTAKFRYEQFLQEYKPIINRLKQHHIASFLGITPTQLSRIKR